MAFQEGYKPYVLTANGANVSMAVFVHIIRKSIYEDREDTEMARTPKILYLDLETSPNLGYTWGRWDQNVIDFERDWIILSYAYKWFDEKHAHFLCLANAPQYRRNLLDDRWLVKQLWKLFDEADVIIAHNGNSFDIRAANARFLFHNLPPPTPHKVVDTLLLARRMFRFASNKLDDLGRCLGFGRKIPHVGFPLWLGCMHGERQSWRDMRKYNLQDIVLLEKVYLKMRSWSPNHPNINQGTEACPKCGSPKIQKRGFEYTLLRRKQRFQCQVCRGWFSGPAKKEDA